MNATLAREHVAPPSGNAGRLVASVCVAGPALVTLVPMAAAPAMPAMAAQFARSGDGQLFAQMVMTAPAVMLILAAPLSGMLAARIGRRAVLLASLVLFIIGGAGVLLIDGRTPLIGLRLLLGVAGGGLLTTSLALIGENFEDRARERVLGYATSMASLVAAVALVFGGSLVDLGGWHAPFALYLLGVPVLVAAWAVVPRTGRPLREGLRDEAGHVGRLAPMLPYYLLLMLLTIGMFTPAIQVPFLLESRGITSATIQGSIIAACSVVAVISAAAYGYLRRWLGVHGFLVIDALVMGLGILLIAYAPAVWVIFAGCVLVGVGAGMSEPATASLIFARTPPAIHALAMGLIVSALNLGQFINPLAMAPLRTAFGVPGSFATLGLLLLAAAVVTAISGCPDLVAEKDHRS